MHPCEMHAYEIHACRLYPLHYQHLDFKRFFTREGTLSGDLIPKLYGGLAPKL